MLLYGNKTHCDDYMRMISTYALIFINIYLAFI